MNHGKHLIAATIAALIVGCSSESDSGTDAENQAPEIMLTDGSSFSVSEGGVVKVPFTINDEDASSVTIDVTTSGNMKGNTSIDDGVLSYTAPWIAGNDDIIETITLTAADNKGKTTSTTVTFSITDGTTAAQVKVNPPSEAFGFEKTREDSLINFWIYEAKPGIVLSYDINDSDADAIALDYNVSSDNFLFRNNIEPSINNDSTQATLTFDIPATDNAYENVAIELTVDDGDDLRRVYANMTVINQPKLQWNNPATSLSESTGGVLPFSMNEPVEQGGAYTATVTTPDGEPLDFDVSYTVNAEAKNIEFLPSDGFLGDRSAMVNLSYTMLIPNSAGEIHEYVKTIHHNVTFKDDRDDDFLSMEKRLQTVRDAYLQVLKNNDDVIVYKALNDQLQLLGHIDGNQRATLDAAMTTTLNVEKRQIDNLFSSIDDAMYDNSGDVDVGSLLNDVQKQVTHFGAQARQAYKDTLTELQLSGELPLSLPDSTSAIALEELWVSHYFGNARYGDFESDSLDSYQFYPRYAYMNVTHMITQESCL